MFKEFVSPKELAVLEAIHLEECAKMAIEPSSKTGEDIAVSIIHLFRSGHDTEEKLRAALNDHPSSHSAIDS